MTHAAFTTLSLSALTSSQIQDGRFDKADRLFQSLPGAYRSCTRNPGDVKEAIPELYYLPELFVNATGFDLGRPQSTGKPIGDVELPPWARGDPWEFVRRHREALESEYVSLRLHRWIDLVFGCRQPPPALNGGQRGAVESCNVFFHLTYPGAVDLPRLREQDPQVKTFEAFLKFARCLNQLREVMHAPTVFWLGLDWRFPARDRACCVCVFVAFSLSTSILVPGCFRGGPNIVQLGT